MRKIDTKAYNKRLHSEILELDRMMKKLSAENVNRLDASLVNTADNYIKLIKDATWSDSSNFNGIELHKIKDMLSHLKTKKKIFIGRDFSSYRKNDDDMFEIRHEIKVPANFDGRQSIIIPRVFYGSEAYNVDFLDLRFIIRGCKMNIYKTHSAVNINIEFDGSSDTLSNINFSFLYIFWR